MWQISHFCEIHSLSYEASKFFAMLSLCVFFGRYFAPGANIVPPIAYKSHSTPFPIRPHVLTPHSWLCGKNWGNFGTFLPPRGASFTPLCGMFLQSPSASSNVANFTFLRNPLSELWVCEFWLLRWSTMVARAWPVCVEVIQDWLLAAPSQTSPPSCFYDTSILRYPFDLFQWKSMGRVAKVL